MNLVTPKAAAKREAGLLNKLASKAGLLNINVRLKQENKV
jgi:hypothetical protein